MEDKTNITAKTINEFIEWAAQFSDGQYLFRGVSTESYKIEASAYRRLPEIDRNDPKKLLKINKDLITKAKALGHDHKNGQQLSDLEILAELQHFGAATCLGFARLHAHNKSYIEPDAQDYLQRGIEADQNDNIDDAIEYYTEVIRLDPPDSSIVSIAHYNRGVAYSGKGEIERAIQDYDQTIRLNPESATAYNNRGYAYRQKGELERAIEDYDRAIQIKSDNVLFYNNRAIALLHLQEWEKAKSDLTAVRNMGVDIIALFRNTYASVPDFEERYNVQMPEDLAALLTPSQA